MYKHLSMLIHFGVPPPTSFGSNAYTRSKGGGGSGIGAGGHSPPVLMSIQDKTPESTRHYKFLYTWKVPHVHFGHRISILGTSA